MFYARSVDGGVISNSATAGYVDDSVVDYATTIVVSFTNGHTAQW